MISLKFACKSILISQVKSSSSNRNYLRRYVKMYLIQIRKIKRLCLFLICVSLFILIIWCSNTPQKSNWIPSQDSDWVSVRLTKGQRQYVDKRGVHVIVGRYMPNNGKKINVTKEMMNANNYNPDQKAGQNGQPVIIPSRDLLVMQQQFQIHRFNLMASDRIPLNRSLPDVRKKRCLNIKIDIEKLPKTTVIIVFHNEAWSTLLRTVWSVINRSPRRVLEEILLIDDFSDREYLKESLDKYVSTLPVRTEVIRAKERIGLVQARLLGARAATGEVLTFLDAHCECTEGWLDSLLARIAEDPTKVVCPVIDIIHDDTFAYVKSFELHWGAFNWQLHFRWYTLSGKQLQDRKLDITSPFPTPTMAGGLFAINKDYFWKLGGYDEQMRIWGGENLEISFRIWQCGGAVEIVPCSHVGHLFRKSSPYSFPGGVSDILYSNLARVAMVWMDEWGDFYFKYNPEAKKVKDRQNITDRLNLRKELKCKSFDWYLSNVWPQHFLPNVDRFFGRIKNAEINQCLIKPLGKGTLNQPMGLAKLNECLEEENLIEMFVFTPDGVIMTDESVCLDAPERDLEKRDGKVRIMACSSFLRQKWKYNKEKKQIIHVSSQRCLDIAKSKKHEDGLIVTSCTDSKSQQWIFESVDWK